MRHRWAWLAAVAALLTVASLMVVGTASASTLICGSTWSRCTVPLYDKALGSVWYVAPNYTSSKMICWTDVYPAYTGLYKSQRWFKVRTVYGDWFTHSSYVYSQETVPHC